jgi:hypothetical protein
MSDAQIPPNAPLSVSLSAAQWNTVLMLLDSSVRSLVTDIQRQCMQQTPREAPPEHMPQRVNGGIAEASHDG